MAKIFKNKKGIKNEIIQAPRNFKINYLENGLWLIFVFPREAKSFSNINAPSFQINKYASSRTIYRKNKHGNTSMYTQMYIEYTMHIEYQKNLPRLVYKAYFTLKRLAMIEARLDKLTYLYNQSLTTKSSKNYLAKVKKLQEEIVYLENVPEGQSFGAFVFTEEYKFQQEQELKAIEGDTLLCKPNPIDDLPF